MKLHQHNERNNVPKLPARNYVAKNWAVVMTSKALPLAHFTSALFFKNSKWLSLLKSSKKARQISTKIDRFLAKFARKIPTKLAFFTDWFLASLAPKISANLSLKILLNWLFFMTYQKPCSVARSIRYIANRSRYKFGGKLASLYNLAHFLWRKQSKIWWHVCFNFSLLI